MADKKNLKKLIGNLTLRESDLFAAYTREDSEGIKLNAKEHALFRAIVKRGADPIEQSSLFKVFERKFGGKGQKKARNHERAGWDVRNSSRKLIDLKLIKRTERATLQLTAMGAALHAVGAVKVSR